ncbi:MAG: hypothetical protein NVS3B11_15460 [Collimonas sp.]
METVYRFVRHARRLNHAAMAASVGNRQAQLEFAGLDLGHVPQMAQPAELHKALLEWLARQ